MRISDWSSDVCSSDLFAQRGKAVGETADDAGRLPVHMLGRLPLHRIDEFQPDLPVEAAQHRLKGLGDIGVLIMQAHEAGTEAQRKQRAAQSLRSEERRVGKEGVSTWRSRWTTSH